MLQLHFLEFIGKASRKVNLEGLFLMSRGSVGGDMDADFVLFMSKRMERCRLAYGFLFYMKKSADRFQ